MNLMTQNLHEDIALNRIAHSMNLSASRLRHLFKAATGISPSRYLKAQRIKHSRQLLETTFLNVHQIMVKVGFKDLSHFTREFKRIHGLPPAQYRKQYLHLTPEGPIEDDGHNLQKTAGTVKK